MSGGVSHGRERARAVGPRSPGRLGAPPCSMLAVSVTVAFRNAAPLLDSWLLGTAVGTPQLGTGS